MQSLNVHINCLSSSLQHWMYLCITKIVVLGQYLEKEWILQYLLVIILRGHRKDQVRGAVLCDRKQGFLINKYQL